MLFGLVTVRGGKVLGDMSGAGAGARLGCCRGCCLEVLVTVRAHMDGRVSWLWQHHDAVRSTMMLLNRFGRCCCSECRESRFVVRGLSAAVTAMLQYGSWVWWRHDAVNIRMMLNLIMLSQDDSWLWYHHDAAFAIAMMLLASP